MLYTIDIWLLFVYLSAENWSHAVWELKKWSVRERETKLIDNELWLPGKTGRLVTQSLTLRVLRPLFQIASSRIAYPSTAAAILRLDIQTPLIQWQRRTVTYILKDKTVNLAYGCILNVW